MGGADERTMRADFVVVGGGAAGAVVAARLTENPEVSVMLLEAGPADDDPLIRMPFGFTSVAKSEYDWDFQSEFEPGLDRRTLHLPAGKVLGGSSSINAMIYLRGNRADYDEWSALGLEGWDYAGVLPYFKKSEHNGRIVDEFHGQGGELGVSDIITPTPLVDELIEGAKSAGVPATADHNGASQVGVARYQTTTRDGERSSSSTAFLAPARDRPNLTVITRAEVVELTLEGTRAVGVKFLKDGALQVVRADQEVVISAGTYRSPQLLMLAGIGPTEHLRRMGIDVVVDLPVGENLQDHPQAPITFFASGGTLESVMTPENRALYAQHRRGPLTSNVAEAGLFVANRSSSPVPDTQITMAPVMVYDQNLGPATASGFTFMSVVAKPVSVGALSLRSAAPRTKPRIWHNFLAEPEDQDTLIEGMRLALEIARSVPVKAVTTGIHRVPKSESRADMLAYVQRSTSTAYHPVGTCSMGTVVDADLRVKGIDGLRVVDASVMPSVPRANTNAPSIMIGEKGADIIRRTSIER